MTNQKKKLSRACVDLERIRAGGSLSLDKKCCECAVDAIPDRHRRFGYRKLELWNLLIDRCDDALVFFRFDAAGAVDETATRFQKLGGRFHDPALQ